MIGIIMATDMEAEPFINGAQLHDTDSPFPIHTGDGYVCIISGIGKANAAMAVAYGHLSEEISLFVNLGAAGAVAEGYAIGDILHVNKVCELDRPTVLERKERFIEPELIDGFNMATLATQDVPAVLEEERESAASVARLADMEAAGFLQACSRFGCPGYIFKVVTDVPGDGDSTIINNVLETREAVYQFFMKNVMPKLKSED